MGEDANLTALSRGGRGWGWGGGVCGGGGMRKGRGGEGGRGGEEEQTVVVSRSARNPEREGGKDTFLLAKLTAKS